jgi:hypothetical protein
MLTPVLLKYFLKTALVVVLAGFGLTYLVLGESSAAAALAAAAVVCADGAALIWVVGKLLDPRGATSGKITVVLVLLAKLLAVGGILWWMLAVQGLDGLGVIIGIGLGVLSLVVGVNRGSTSPEGQRAIQDTEREIAEEMGDNEDESQ